MWTIEQQKLNLFAAFATITVDEPGTIISKADEGKTVEIKDGKLMVDGVARTVQWGRAKKHADCAGKIRSVEPKFMGKVKLDDCETFFENPACYEPQVMTFAQWQVRNLHLIKPIESNDRNVSFIQPTCRWHCL